MANSTTTRVLVDGPRSVVFHTKMTSDGASGEYTDNQIIAMNNFLPVPDRLTIEQIWYAANGCSAILEFNGLSDRHLLTIPDGADGYMDFRSFGGIKDDAEGSGGILVTTTGFATAGDAITLIIQAKKTYD